MPDWFLVLTLLVVGFILLAIEFITPGFSIPGTLGLLFLGFASYTAFKHLNFITGLLVSIGSIFIVIVLFRLFLRSRTYIKLRLQDSEKGFGAASEELKNLIGKRGISITPLRPSGTAIIDGKRIDVITDGIFMDRDVKLKVIRIEGAKVFVKEAQT